MVAKFLPDGSHGTAAVPPATRRRGEVLFRHWRLPTLTAPPTRSPCEPPTSTTCAPGTRHGMVGPEGCCRARPASASSIFADSTTSPNSPATPMECSFGCSPPTRRPCAILGCLRHCYSPGVSPLVPRRAPRCASHSPSSRLAHGSPILRSVFPLAAARRPTARGSILQRQSSHQPLKRLKGPTNAKVERQSDQNANFENIGDHFQNSIS